MILIPAKPLTPNPSFGVLVAGKNRHSAKAPINLEFQTLHPPEAQPSLAAADVGLGCGAAAASRGHGADVARGPCREEGVILLGVAWVWL